MTLSSNNNKPKVALTTEITLELGSAIAPIKFKGLAS
jgi:hypothetical protein